MAPNISTSKAAPKDAVLNSAEARAQEVAEKILEAVSEMRDHVEANCDDVGENFAEEARRIHYGEAEERGIHGRASDEEADELDDEGIEFYRLPGARRSS